MERQNAKTIGRLEDRTCYSTISTAKIMSHLLRLLSEKNGQHCGNLLEFSVSRISRNCCKLFFGIQHQVTVLQDVWNKNKHCQQICLQPTQLKSVIEWRQILNIWKDKTLSIVFQHFCFWTLNSASTTFYSLLKTKGIYGIVMHVYVMICFRVRYLKKGNLYRSHIGYVGWFCE